MSFTGIVKDEISKLPTSNTENMTELSAIIRNSSINKKNIKITTENASMARRVFVFIKDIYNLSPKITVRKGYNYNKNKMIYILDINEKIDIILDDLGINDKPSEFIVSDEEMERAYLRGLFLCCGSINDPKTSMYHLEFLVDTENYANFVSEVLNNYELNSKVIKRNKKYMIYVKEAERISDFLRIVNASNAVMYFEDMRIYRDHKNMINRLNNMEQANIDKMIMAATEQINDIEIIQESGGLDLLGEKEKIVAEYRLRYRDASLLELSEIITMETNKKISKSGINHRIKKIKELAEKIRNHKGV